MPCKIDRIINMHKWYVPTQNELNIRSFELFHGSLIRTKVLQPSLEDFNCSRYLQNQNCSTLSHKKFLAK